MFNTSTFAEMDAYVKRNLAGQPQFVVTMRLMTRRTRHQHHVAFTVGNYRFNLPEILVIALDPPDATRVLNVLGEVERSVEHPFPVGIPFSINNGAPITFDFLPSHVVHNWAPYLIHYIPDPFAVQQVTFADKCGRLPMHPECAEPYSFQRPLAYSVH